MTKVAKILKALKLKQAELARFLNVAPYTVSRWANGTECKGTSACVVNSLFLIVQRIEQVKKGKMRELAIETFGSYIKTMTVGECIRRSLPTYILSAAEARWEDGKEDNA